MKGAWILGTSLQDVRLRIGESTHADLFGPLMRVRTPARALSDGRGSGAPYGRTTGASTRELRIQAARTLIGRGGDSPTSATS